MPTDASFRFSTYLTLALTCVALGYAEFDPLPEVAVFAALSVVALGVLYFLESRVAFLSIPAANRLGMVVGSGYLLWAVWRVKHEIVAQEFSGMGWPMLIVALCGPLVMVAVVAKVARSDKHAGDYWTLHGVALAGIGLAAALSEDIACFVLLGLYLVVAVWSITLLHLGRASGGVPPIPGGRQPATKTIAVSADPTGHRTDLRPAIVWAVIALAVAVPLYLLTPRSSAEKSEFGKPRIEIGYAADQMVNLNRTGPLKKNTEVAFEFAAAYTDGTPKTDVNPEQRWMGKVLRQYARGEWQVGDDMLLPHISFAGPGWRQTDEPLLARRGEVWSPPHLGKGQFTLTFDIPARLPANVLADPVIWAPNEPPPFATLTRHGPQGWLPVPDGTFFPTNMPTQPADRRYLQVYRPLEDTSAAPPFRFIEVDSEEALPRLCHNPVPRVREYADQVLEELVRKGALPANFRDEVTLHPKPQYCDLIARKFTDYLASTPTLRYTTELHSREEGD